MWASRKGNVEIVDTLLKAGANVDTAGMVRSKFYLLYYFYCYKIEHELNVFPTIYSIDLFIQTFYFVSYRELYKLTLVNH